MQTSYRLRNQDKLYTAMVRAGIADKHALAEKSGVSYGSITHLASGKWSLHLVLKIALALHVEVDDLFSKIKK